MAKTIAIVNQKGGVGKTTTCVNLAAALKNQGCRVLVCDFDPQANTTSGFGVDKTTSPNIYDVLLNGTETAKAISSTSYGDVLPSNKALAGATIEMIALEQREYRLKNALEQVAEHYDYIFIFIQKTGASVAYPQQPLPFFKKFCSVFPLDSLLF